MQRWVLGMFLLFLGENHLFGKGIKSQHSLGAEVMIAFKPSNEFVTKPSPNNTVLVYVYPLYKSYKNPGISYYYQWQTAISKNIKMGATIGCNIRYLEEVIAGEYETFYSFPLRTSVDWKALSTKEREYGIQWMGGYNFKHAKHKFLDGLGGFTTGLSVIRYHREHHFGLKAGFDFYQEASFLKFVPSAAFPDMIEETFRFNQFLYQFRFGFYKRLN